MPSTSSPGNLSPSPQGHAWLRWLPFLALLLAAIALWLLWQRLPECWVIHWGQHGHPNRWVRKTVLSVFFPIGFGLFLCSVLEGLAVYLLVHSQGGKPGRISPPTAAAIAALTAAGLRIISVGLATVLASLALVLPLWPPQRSGLLVLSLLGILGSAIAVSMWCMWHDAQALRAQSLPTELEGWNGLIYRNARDPRLWVPKFAGMGYTLNFAHRRAWWWLLALLAPPLLALLLVMTQMF